MRKIVLSLTTAAALSSFAMAGGDIVPVAPAPADNWSGFYVGAQVGGTWGDADTKADVYDYEYTVGQNEWVKIAEGDSKPNPNGFIGGLYAGYNWLFDNDWLVGIEGSYNWSDAKDDATVKHEGEVVGDAEAEIKQKWEAAVIARVGKVIDDSYMPYILGGATWTKLDASASFQGISGSDSDTVSGWTVGAGIEFKLTENLHARAQYRYSDYNDAKFSDEATLPEDGTYKVKATTDYNAHMLQVGLSYRF